MIFPWESALTNESAFVGINIFRKIFTDLVTNGRYSAPRGQLILELEDYSFILPARIRFQNFECRKFKLDYLKDEFLWYLKGDRFDVSIGKKAKIWKSIINQDGSLNSNYGQYIFPPGGQFDRTVECLEHDQDSRRASIVILSQDHVLSETNDLPCTYALNFRIRHDELKMSVHMRSQDAIFGMGNDIPTFSFVHEMVYNALRTKYPRLAMGTYHHCVDSFHVYERHFQMLREITGRDLSGAPLPASILSAYIPIECPNISGHDEVRFLRALDFSEIPESFKFTRWLNERDSGTMKDKVPA